MNKRKQRPNILSMIEFWSTKSLPAYCMEKGGNFNLNLYLDYLKICKNGQKNHKNN